MVGCLLCLDLNNEFVDCIEVNSTQWQELNIKDLIEKYLWSMEAFFPAAWLCNSCWQELYNFHKFYMRIKDAHLDFNIQIKIQNRLEENDLSNDKFKHFEDSKKLLNTDIFNETSLEPEIVIDILTTNDNHKHTATEENNENLIKINIPQSTNDMEYTKQDPLKNVKKPKTKNCLKTKSARQSSVDRIKHVPSDSNDSLTDSDYATLGDISKRTKKYKRGLTQRKQDCSKPETKDKFLAKNYVMTCIICQQPMTTFKVLLKHFETKHKERGYAVCCNKKFFERSILLEHVRGHVDPNYFKCNQCSKVLSTRKVLKTHQLSHLSEEEKKFACNECGKNFGEQRLLSNHIRSVHLKKYVKICDICGKTLRCSEMFERHMSEHEGRPIPPVYCEICGSRLSHKKALKRHMDIQHPVGGKQSHTCNICSKVSPNIVALRKHIRCTHNTGNIHKCTICGRGFKRAQTLRDHVATHTGKALYTCPWCPKTFNSNGCMHAHRKRHHPKEWEDAHRQKYSREHKLAAVAELTNNDVS